MFKKFLLISFSSILISCSSFLSSSSCCFFLYELYFIVFPRIISKRDSKNSWSFILNFICSASVLSLSLFVVYVCLTSDIVSLTILM